MRAFALMAPLLLAGCANAVDLGKNTGTAIDAFKGGFVSDIDLEAALLKDYAWKNGQLAYISNGAYECGDNQDPQVVGARNFIRPNSRLRKDLNGRKEKIVETMTKKFGKLTVIVEYGKFLNESSKMFADIDAAATRLQTSMDTIASFAPSEVDAFLVAIKSALALAKQARQSVQQNMVTVIAYEVAPKLDAAIKELSQEDNLKEMALGTSLALKLWDSCAKERLVFLRDYIPRGFNFSRQPNAAYLHYLAGQGHTPVVTFAHEYKTYLEEREAFVGRRPDYRALLQAIGKANRAILEGKKGEEIAHILDSVNGWGQAIIEIRNKYESLRKDSKAL